MLTIICGDALEKLRELPDESAHCFVTSPPYWGLRDYGTAQWEGGDAGCDHKETIARHDGGRENVNGFHGSARSDSDKGAMNYRNVCGKCGAKRIDSQLGLEKTPEEYVAKMVEVFREGKRVLRKDGTLWLNLSSSYFGGEPGSGGSGTSSKKQVTNRGAYFSGEGVRVANDRACGTSGTGRSDSPNPDSDCFCLCDECRASLLLHSADNRQQILSAFSVADLKVCMDAQKDSQIGQPAALPRDVPASTKNESFRQSQVECYHCANCDACLNVLASASRDSQLCVRKAGCNPGNVRRGSASRKKRKDALDLAYSTIAYPKFKAKDLIPIPWMVAMALQADGWWLRSDIIWAKPNPMPESCTDRPTKSHEYLFLLTKSANYFYDAEAIREEAEYGRREQPLNTWNRCKINGERVPGATKGGDPSAGRNKRSVWTVATAPYPEAHFATYPPDLIKPCIMAGTSAKGCCAKCGAPRERIVERSGGTTGKSWHNHENDLGRGQRGGDDGNVAADAWARGDYKVETLGWQPTCKHFNGTDCEAEFPVIPCTVLDPFAGSGTTGMVALELGREAILIELNPSYVKLIEQRCNVTPGLALA